MYKKVVKKEMPKEIEEKENKERWYYENNKCKCLWIRRSDINK